MCHSSFAIVEMEIEYTEEGKCIGINVECRLQDSLSMLGNC